MGRRNYCMGDYDPASGELAFTLCIEKSQGSGTTKECVHLRISSVQGGARLTLRVRGRYVVRTPPPRW